MGFAEMEVVRIAEAGGTRSISDGLRNHPQEEEAKGTARVNGPPGRERHRRRNLHLKGKQCTGLALEGGKLKRGCDQRGAIGGVRGEELKSTKHVGRQA